MYRPKAKLIYIKLIKVPYSVIIISDQIKIKLRGMWLHKGKVCIQVVKSDVLNIKI